MIKELPTDFEFDNAQLIGNFANGSPEWHELRKGAVGGSQVGAILGVNPWESAVTAYYKNIGAIEDSIEPSMSMRLGTKLETPILEIFAEEHPDWSVFTTGTYASTVNPRFHANPDALYVDSDGSMGVVEVKFSRDYWAEVPKHYRAQVLWYCHVLGLKKGILVALAGSTYQEFVIEFDQFELDALVQQVQLFLAHVDAKKQPEWDGSESTFKTIRALNPDIDENEVCNLGDLGVHLSNAKDDFNAAEAKYREMQSRTLDAMGNAKYGEVDGLRLVYRSQRNGGTPFLVWKK